MNTNNANKTTINLEDSNGNFKTGEAYRASILRVHETAVNVKMPGGNGNGMVSTRCWGKGEARTKALAGLKVGDTLDVVVKSYDPRTRTLSLLLSGFEKMIRPQSARPKRHAPQSKRPSMRKPRAAVRPQAIARKSAYQPLAKGATMLVDTANLIGMLGAEHAALRLRVIAEELENRGYKALFFWEHRSFDWAWRSQENADEVSALKEFSRRKGVSLVGEESDLAILQAAQEIPDSVVVTQDRLADYAEVYPDLVGSARHRGFSMIAVGGRILLTICGLKDAIIVPESCEAVPAAALLEETGADEVGGGTAVGEEDWDLEVDEDVLARRAERPEVAPCRHGILGVADGCILRGDVRRGLALLGRVARKLPKIYRDMAEVFDADGALPDARVAARYDRLADRREKALRQRVRRNRRQRAERRRAGGDSRPLSCAA